MLLCVAHGHHRLYARWCRFINSVLWTLDFRHWTLDFPFHLSAFICTCRKYFTPFTSKSEGTNIALVSLETNDRQRRLLCISDHSPYFWF